MNHLAKTIFRVALFTLTLAGCSKPPPPVLAQKASQAKASAPVSRESFRSLDEQQAITFISSNELELREGSEIILCTYSKEQNTFRVIAPILGSNRVLYYSQAPGGLVAHDGKILMSLPALCRRKASQIAIACVAYSNDHNDDYPRTLAELSPKYLTDGRILRNPLAPPTDTSTGWDYFPGNVFRDLKDKEMPRDKVLFRSRYVLDDGTVCTAFYDAHIEFKK